MTVTALALILLSASYLWLRRWQLSRSHLLRSDGHALYFLVVAAAVPLGVWTACSIKAFLHLIGHPALLDEIVDDTLGRVLVVGEGKTQVALFGFVAIAAIPAAFVLAWLLNRPVVACSALTARLLFRLGVIEELEGFLWDVSERGLSVMATTSSGKVYVGNSLEMPLQVAARRYVRLEPLLSGYRDEQQEFKVTTSYRWISGLPRSSTPGARELCRRDFDVLLPIDSIQSVHSFDLATFVARYAISKADKGANLELKPPPVLSEETSAPSTRSPTTSTEWCYLGFVVAVFAAPCALALSLTTTGAFTVLFGAVAGVASAIEPIRRWAKKRSDRIALPH